MSTCFRATCALCTVNIQFISIWRILAGVGRDFYLTLDLINFLVQALALVRLEM